MKPESHMNIQKPQPETSSPLPDIRAEDLSGIKTTMPVFSEAKYRQIFESFEDLYYEIDMSENIRVLSPSVQELTGWRADELIGRPVRDIYLYPDARDTLLETLVANGSVQNYVLQLRKKDGTPAFASINAHVLYDATGKPDGISGTIRNITELIQAQNLLRESEAKFRTLAESSPFAILIYQNDRYIYVNPAAERICGYTAQELYHMNFWEFVHPEDRPLVEARGKARQSGQTPSTNYEFRIIAKGGIEKWVILNGATIAYGGKSAGLISVFEITDLKHAIQEKEKLQEQLRQAQKLESVGLLAGGVAHDLNNLLQPIIGYSELLLMDSSQKDTSKRYIRQIISTSERARDLVRQLMAFGRKQVLEIQSLDLNRVIDDFIRLLRRTLREDIQIKPELSPDIPNIRADRSQVEQILMNLAVNAQDAMPDGGLLTIGTENAVLDACMVSQHPDVTPGAYVQLLLSDTGFGMNADTTRKIFDPFFTTKEKGKGTGLGLSTVYGIIRQHEGYIWVYSEPGHGTVFKIFLPVSGEGKDIDVSARVNGVPAASGNEAILVAEDDAMVRELTCTMLKQLGYRVLSAETAEECLRLAENAIIPIDLLLTDVVMPEMSGKDLHLQIARIRPDVRVMYMSGYTANIIAHRGVLDEGVAFIQKPFSLQTLSQKIRMVLG
jgi:PAS domain S-box-containing protein